MKHGHSNKGSRTYKSWKAMRRRCNCVTHHAYQKYGGRGIAIDPRWDDFAAFLEDMGERPEGTSLDRIDNDGPYHKANCRWATRTQQARNTSYNKPIEFNGETVLVSHLEDRLGLTQGTITKRLKAGWPMADAISPNRQPGKKHHSRIKARFCV
jgi:hypothetical protein